MSSFSEKMSFYAAYHQEPRNVAIHIVGVPLISFSLLIAFSWIELFKWNGIPITFAMAFTVGILLYYFYLDLFFASIAALLFGFLLYWGHIVSLLDNQTCWVIFSSSQLLGWGTQLYGHYVFERKRPAFLDNFFQAVFSAPLFVVAEICFKLGIKKDLEKEVKDKFKYS